MNGNPNDYRKSRMCHCGSEADSIQDGESMCELCAKQLRDAGKTKPTNPKEGLGIRKVPTHCIPSGVLLEMGLAMMEGGRKYGAHNYREMGARYSVYSDAIERHRIAWWEGEDTDADSGLHHLTKIIGCCLVMRDSMLMGNDIDDRPIRYPNGLDMEHYNKLAGKIIDKYPDCKEPFTEKPS